MVDYGDVGFAVTFEGIEVGDHTSVSIEPIVTSSNTTTSSGVRNRKNKKASGFTVTFEGLDFAEDEKKYLAIRDMILKRQRIEECTISSQKRWQNGVEYIESTNYISGTVDVSRTWGVDDDWTRTITVNFDKEVLNDPIKL
nr:hypothetical protein [Methanobrevibacter arboriphilus]